MIKQVFTGVFLFLIFDLKHKLLVLVRTALHSQCFGQIYYNTIFFPIKVLIVTSDKIFVYCNDKFSRCSELTTPSYVTVLLSK